MRQLLAFSRRQARPAGYLSLNEAIRRAEHLLRPIVGDAITLRVSLGDVESVAASEDEIEQLILEVVFAAAATLPFGGTLDLQTAPVTTNFLLSTQLTAVAAGSGALSLVTSSSLTRTISRCGGLVRTSVEAGRSNALHVILPCCHGGYMPPVIPVFLRGGTSSPPHPPTRSLAGIPCPAPFALARCRLGALHASSDNEHWRLCA